MQIDQDRRNYRAMPIKGEPVFQPEAGKRILTWALAMVFLLGLAVLIQFLFGGIAEWLADTVTGWIIQ